MRQALTILLLLFATISTTTMRAASTYDPGVQSANLWANESQAVYFGNVARAQNGQPPLRWNLQLTHAARWFSWDSTENRPSGFCGHQDTQGKWPSDRIVTFHYLGFGGAENSMCGYVAPQAAIDAWMNSSGHRANLLDPNSREIGLGYYQRTSDGRGYIVQDFGVDADYAPVVIAQEAPATTTRETQLYIYDHANTSGFQGMSSATQMQVSNEPCFSGAVWEPYGANRTWSLADGSPGWRTVYVRMRDSLSRTSTVSDTIYFGSTPPADQIGPGQLSSTQPTVTLYDLSGGALPKMQFSLGWATRDSEMSLLWGTGGKIADPGATDGSAFLLGSPGNMAETSAWVYTTNFFKDTPLVAYVRLKVANNSSSGEVARVQITGGTTLSLKGTDFAAPNTYQEFPISFTFPSSETFLTLQFYRSGTTDVSVDGATFFTAALPVQTPYTWSLPGGNYRGQGIWVRYTDEAGHFSPITEAATAQATTMTVVPNSLALTAQLNGVPRTVQALKIVSGCSSGLWQVADDAAWLQTTLQDTSITVRVDPTGLSAGLYTATIQVTPTSGGGTTVSIPVQLQVVAMPYGSYLPLVQR